MRKKIPSAVVFIPCYNEENRMPVEEVKQFLMQEHKVKLAFLNDGSIDNTLELLKGIEEQFPGKAEVISFEKNRGKGEVLRRGMLRYIKENNDQLPEYVGYFDADLATPLDQFFWFFDFDEKRNYPDMILGSRVKLLGSTNVDRLWYRHYFGRVFATAVSKMLGLAVYDTQCGAKLMKTEITGHLLQDEFISSWLFDVELIYRYLNHYGKEKAEKEIWEIPVRQWIEKGGSKIGLSYLFKMPFELIKIWLKYRQ